MLMSGHPLEGSCQEATRLPYLPSCIFFAEACSWRLAPDLPCCPHPRLRWLWSRSHEGDVPDTHQDQGAAWIPRLLARPPAPGTLCAPENPRYPAVSNLIVTHRVALPLTWVHSEAGSRQRRRTHSTDRSEAIWYGPRRDSSHLMVISHPDIRPLASAQPPPLLNQTPWPHQTAPDRASCDNRPAPVCAPPS
jgi:hypothetical protein